jgi:hypothetical protein
MLALAGTGRKKHHASAPDGGQHAVYHTWIISKEKVVNRDNIKIKEVIHYEKKNFKPAVVPAPDSGHVSHRVSML